MLVTARGTSEGLMLRLDGRRQDADLTQALKDFMAVRRRFLEGQAITLEWLGEEDGASAAHSLGEMLKNEYGVTVASVRVRGPMAAIQGGAKLKGDSRGSLELLSPSRAPLPEEPSIPTKTLFDGVDALLGGSSEEFGGSVSVGGGGVPLEVEAPVVDSLPFKGGELWDDPDTRTVFMTLRSGQRIDTEHSLVIFGDVNSGAEVSAGGDVIVLGTLRGVAHAGAYDETGGGRVIFALSLEPTQLRIGQVITRGGGESPTRSIGARVKDSKGAEVARVDGDTIVVEPYRSRIAASRGPLGV